MNILAHIFWRTSRFGNRIDVAGSRTPGWNIREVEPLPGFFQAFAKIGVPGTVSF